MALFEDYEGKRKELLKKIQTFEEFEKADPNVHDILEIARRILTNPKDNFNADLLIGKGSKLAGYYGYLLTKGNEAWAEYKVAEVAFRSVRDALMIALKVDRATVTEAKASATRDTGILEVDVIAKEKRSKDYEAVAKWCERMLSWVQSVLSQMRNERGHTRIADEGKPKQ
jgi:hypothetical protein